MQTPLVRIRAGAVSLAIVFLLSICAYRFLGDYTWLEAIWMVVVTISTVGFGEQSESNEAVQITTILLIIVGVSAAAYTFGGLAQLALEGEVERALGRKRMDREISKLRDHIVICGFGRLGSDLANQLRYRAESFVVIDIDPAKVIVANEQGAPTVTGDATDETILTQANLDHAKAVVTALPTDAENVFITLTSRNICPSLQIIAKAENESSCRKLRQAGADKVVMPHKVGAQQMERMISRPTTADLVELFAETSNLDMELDEFLISDRSDLVGKSLGQSQIKEQFNLLVIGIKNESGDFQFNPGADQEICANDTLLVIGDVADINRMKSIHV